MTKALVTYAQNREDLFLWALLGHRKNGFYVDVGAHHPVFHSVTKLFYDRGWSGVNLEPNPLLHKEFLQTRKRDINLNIGAADREATLSFRQYPNHNGLSTFSKEIMRLHEASGFPYEDVNVKVKTLKSILKSHKIKKIDFLKIDVEGFEVEVVNGNDWDLFRPRVLVVEATVRHELKPIIDKLGYKFEFFDGLNNYYVDKKCDEPLTIYNYAPRILSTGHYTKSEYELTKQVAALNDELTRKAEENARLNELVITLKRFKSQPKNIARATKQVAHTYMNKMNKVKKTK